MRGTILIGCLLLVLTSFVHALLTRVIYGYLDSRKAQTPFQRIIIIEAVVLMIMLASLAEATLWAGCYVMIGAFDSMEESVYFSLVTFSTLGYGDVVLSQPYRLLGGFEAANGIILFGWSTALLVTAVQKLQTGQKP